MSAIKPPKSEIKLPKTILVGGRTVKIKVVELEDCYGQFLFDKMMIQIDVKTMQDTETLRETLRHEIVEASLLISGVGWSETYQQESVVRALDNIFFPAWARVSPIFERV
jgi:hypothetical protein